MSIVKGNCGHSFHMVRSYSVAYESAQTYDAEHGQHCALIWIGQEASKGLCPMCRQSRTSYLWTLDDAETVIQNSSGSKVGNESEVESVPFIGRFIWVDGIASGAFYIVFDTQYGMEK